MNGLRYLQILQLSRPYMGGSTVKKGPVLAGPLSALVCGELYKLLSTAGSLYVAEAVVFGSQLAF